MTELPFISYTMSGTEVETVLSMFDNLKKTYTTNFDPGISLGLSQFNSFQGNKILDKGPYIKIQNARGFFCLMFIQVEYDITIGKYTRSSQTEFQLWGILPLKKDYGHILIKHETILDKILDLVHPIEIDFEEDPDFSKRYYVLSDDKPKAQQFLAQTVRNQIKNVKTPGIIIEVFDRHLIIGNKTNLLQDISVDLAQFLSSITGSI